jgi:GAF domain-containing protein
MSTDILISTLTTLAKTLAGITDLPTATFLVDHEAFTLLAVSKVRDHPYQSSFQKISVKGAELDEFFASSGKIFSLQSFKLTDSELMQFASSAGFKKVAFLPIQNGSLMQGLVLVGSYNEQLNEEALGPFIHLTQLASTAFSQSAMIEKSEKCIKETESLNAIINAIKTPWDTTAFFEEIYEQIKQNIGEFAFASAIYNEKTSSISIPYIFEDGRVRSVDAFPLGEGLTSVLIRTKQPLLLNENVQKQAESLGAKIDGKPAQSWMGAPIIAEDQAIGAFIVQDLEKENSFSEEQLKYLCTLANQVSRILFNARILDEVQSQINKLQMATEIARDISSALNLDELLLKAINLIRDRFNFYHAAIFLIDSGTHNAIIREATGDAGAQLKRIGHKLAVGSKSVVGFVAGKGEALVVNDIQNDATHLPNPMLPATRAEAAIPMKIGDRILGVLDVQSTIPYSFNSHDISIFQTLADQLAIAVSNTELFGEIQEHLSQHRLLHHITTSAASGTTLEEALASAVKGLQVTLGGDRVSILLSDEGRKQLTVKAWVGYSENASDITVPFGSGITGWVAAHRKPLRVNDIAQDARYILVSPNTRSELALPLIFRNDILGVLNVESEQVGAYNENDEEMLGTLAGSLAAIIANARLVDQIRKQAERERLLNEISSKIRRSSDVRTILTTTIQELQRVTGVRKAQIDIGIAPNEREELKTEPLNARGE